MHPRNALVALALACGDPTEAPVDSAPPPVGDSGTTPPGPTGPPCDLTVPPIVQGASASCSALSATAAFAATTFGQSYEPRALFLIETGRPDPWSEAHPLSVAGPASCGDELALTLDVRLAGTPESTAAYVPGESTSFTCEEHFDPDVLTFAVAVSDASGALSDCFAFGHDAVGLVSGAYEPYAVPPGFDLGTCVVGPGR